MDVLGRTEAQLLFALAVGSASKFLASYMLRKKKTREFELAGKVKELFVHPVKSCACISVKEAQCFPLGLTYKGIADRSWMVVTESGGFLSLRKCGNMTRVSIDISRDDAIELSAPGLKPLLLPNKPKVDRASVKKFDIFGVHGEGLDCGDEAAEWISQALEKKGLRIVFSAPSLMKRQCSLHDKAWDDKALPEDEAGFQDAMPFMMMNDKSLAALNTKLEKEVTARNFRPNLFIEGKSAWDEDKWEEVRIGETVTFRCLDPCTRCSLPTVDPDTGARNKDLEPLKTLRRIRCYPIFGNSPLFGLNAAVKEGGTIRVGDPVYVLYKPDDEKQW